MKIRSTSGKPYTFDVVSSTYKELQETIESPPDEPLFLEHSMFDDQTLEEITKILDGIHDREVISPNTIRAMDFLDINYVFFNRKVIHKLRLYPQTPSQIRELIEFNVLDQTDSSLILCKILQIFRDHTLLEGIDRYLKYCSCETCTYAARHGFLTCLRYAHEKGCYWDEWTCARAAEGGSLDCLKYARENGCPWDRWTCAFAAKSGDLSLLQYARDNGCPWDELTCMFAARYNHLHILRYAHENGCPMGLLTCANAAEGGSLSCLHYAYKNGCPWNEMICWSAAKSGSLDCLKYAHENGCPWNINTIRYAKQYRHFDCLKYARDNGCPDRAYL